MSMRAYALQKNDIVRLSNFNSVFENPKMIEVGKYAYTEKNSAKVVLAKVYPDWRDVTSVSKIVKVEIIKYSIKDVLDVLCKWIGGKNKIECCNMQVIQSVALDTDE
jgi:hypothetical protein